MECKCGKVVAAAASPTVGVGEQNEAVANQITAGARREAYGPPEENHKRTALMWSSYLAARGYPRALSVDDVCYMNVLQKISRDIHSPQPDNLVDSHGYLNNIEEMRASS
jgi:hypothetical protein